MQNNFETPRTGSLLRRIDIPLLLLIVFLAAINIPYWGRQFMVGHDTKNIYLIFHYFYNHLVWYGELPQWLPYGEYGYSSLFYQLCNISPCTYLAGFLGWLLRVKDTLILFKLAAFGDQLLFLFGLHLLSGKLYRNRITCFVICLLGVGCVVWTWQIYWGLRFFYLLPLALYFFYRFFDEHLSWAFWGTLLTLLFSFVGGLPYWAPIYLFLFLVMTLVMLPGHWRAFGTLLRPGWRGGLLALVVVVSTVALGYLLLTCLDGLHNYSPGRATRGMYTDLRTFLTFNDPVWRYAHLFIDGAKLSGAIDGYPDDLILYVGLLPVGILLMAILYVRDRKFCSLFGGLAAILLIAGSGLSSIVLYWLIPGMKTFRHLGLLLALAKILLLLSAGFGIDLLASRLKVRGWLEEHFRPITYFTLLAGLCIIFDMVVSQMVYNPKSWATPMQLALMLPKGGEWIVVRLAVWAVALTLLFACVRLKTLNKRLSPQFALGMLVFVCLIDIGSYQLFQWHNRCQGKYAGRLELTPLRYHDVRKVELSTESKRDDAVIKSSENESYHGFYANIVQHDPCVPVGHIDIFPRGVHELVTARGANPVQGKIWGTFIPFSDPLLLNVLGCNDNKLRFVSQAEYGRTDEEIHGMISSSKVLDTTVILKSDSRLRPVGRPMPDPAPMTYSQTFFNANRLDLDVLVKPGLSGWLVFADTYNPHWKAYVNGKEQPVLEAYGAFKAVAVAGGESKVSFRYENRWQKYAAALLSIVAMVLASGCIVGLIWQLFKGGAETTEVKN